MFFGREVEVVKLGDVDGGKKEPRSQNPTLTGRQSR